MITWTDSHIGSQYNIHVIKKSVDLYNLSRYLKVPTYFLEIKPGRIKVWDIRPDPQTNDPITTSFLRQVISATSGL